jgi:hypothetical protein
MEGDRWRRAVSNRGGLEWRWELGGEREGSAWEVRGEAESGVGVFIGEERRWLGRVEHAELTQPSMAVREKYLAVDSAGEVSAGIRGRGVIAALWTKPFRQGVVVASWPV